MEQYKSNYSDFIKDRLEFLNAENQYEEICYLIYYTGDDFDEANILQDIEAFINGSDIINSIEKIKKYTNKENIYSIPQELYSPPFIYTLKNIIIDPNFDKYSDSIAKIVRNLWQLANSPNDCIIFDDEMISTFFTYFNKSEIETKTICIVFDAFYILLSRYPEKLPMLINHNLIDAIINFLLNKNLDQRNCNGRLAFPFYLIYLIILNSPPESLYFSPFIEICLNYISSQYGLARIISTQCIFDICLKNNQLINFFFTIPQNIQTVVRSHFLNFQHQIKFLYALDTLLLQSGIEDIFINYVKYDNCRFFKNLSKYVFNPYLSQIQEEIKHVLLFLYNVMDLVWSFLSHPDLYDCSDDVPIIYRIIDLSNNSKYKERNLSGNCISRFITVSNVEDKIKIARDGGFSSICNLVQNGDVKSQYVILCALKELLSISELFTNEAFEIGLQDTLYQLEIEDEECNLLINDILCILKSSDKM